MAAASSPTSAYRAQMVETLEDPVSRELMTRAVTLVPCGHVFNEDTINQVLAQGSRLCPIGRCYIRRRIPNYTIRDLAQTTQAHPEERAQPREQEPTEESYAHFARAKALSEQDDYEGAITALLQALQISPHFQKAQAYLDFCLSRAAEKEPSASPSQASPNPQGDKDKYINLLLTLLEHPQIHADSTLKEILATAVERLMESSIPHLTSVEENHYKWTQKLLGEDSKVRVFVVEKLQTIHGKGPRSQAASRSEPATSLPLFNFSQGPASSTPSLFSGSSSAMFGASMRPPAASLASSGGMPFPFMRPPTESSAPSSLMFGASMRPPAAPAAPTSAMLGGGMRPLSVSLAPSGAALEASMRPSAEPSDSSSVIRGASMLPAIPFQAFGREKWMQYFGKIGEEPPLPPDIHQILQGSCPFYPGKTVQETHMLVLIPATVNGALFTLDTLEQLIQHPKQGYATKYEYYEKEIKKALGNQSPPKSYWVLMTKDVLPNSISKSFVDQCALVENCAQRARVPYQVPTILESATSILLEHVQTGTRLYSCEPWIYTRCQEKVENGWNVAGYQRAVGGFGPGGLNVVGNNVGFVSMGVASLRKF